MSNPSTPETDLLTKPAPATDPDTAIDTAAEPEEDFGQLLTQFEQSRARTAGEPNRQIAGTVVAITADAVLVDIGYKSEGTLPLSAFEAAGETINVGDRLSVSVKGRNEEGYYELSRHKVEQPKDWDAFERAFAEKAAISGTVTAVVKGGLTVDVGVRAFLPASRSGTRDAAEMEALVGQEIRCRITKLDVADEDVVVDRRALLEEDERSNRDLRYAQLAPGEILDGTVRSLADYGAFIDLGGIDGLLHIGEIAWTRVAKPEDVLTVGQTVRVKVIKIDPETRRLSLSMKQLEPHPWEAVPDTYKVGDRVRGNVTRVTDFGAFLELSPGVEGMIHVSEMSWVKKVRKPADMLSPGDVVEAVILGIDVPAQRIALGLKQALGDPWAEAPARFPVGSVVEGPVTRFTTFGAFVEVAEGIEGMVHISEIVADRRLNHPQDVLRTGQRVHAKVLEVDRDKRQLRLSIKGMIPTGLEDFLAEHAVGDLVTGRIVDVSADHATVELGEGVLATSTLEEQALATAEAAASPALDLSSLTSMLNARWKGATSAAAKPQAMSSDQVRSFRITRIDAESKTIELSSQAS